MEMTPAQLDAIATKLLGWKLLPCVHSFGRYDISDGHERAGLDVGSGHDAMLVLEAMGRWCEADPRLLRVSLESCGNEWICEIIQHLDEESDDTLESELGDTIPAAVFACAAQLVERM